MEKMVSYRKMSKMHDRPGRSGCAAQERQNDEPWEEEDEDVDRPHPRVLKPRCVLVQIHWLHCLHVQIPHSFLRANDLRFCYFPKQKRGKVGEAKGFKVVEKWNSHSTAMLACQVDSQVATRDYEVGIGKIVGDLN